MAAAVQVSAASRSPHWTICNWKSAGHSNGFTTIARNTGRRRSAAAGSGWPQARLQFQQAMTYRRIADRHPSCIDEKRAVEAAKRRLQLAQEKVETVRHWRR